VVLLKIERQQAEIFAQFKFLRGGIAKKREGQIVMRGDAHG
jgi:hypothetical protein